MKQYSAEQNRFEQMIMRFDEDISLKASKMSLKELRKHVEDKYTISTEIDKAEDQMRDRIDTADDQIGELKEHFEKLGKQMKMLVKAEIRRAMLYKDPSESAQTSLPTFSAESGQGQQSQINVQIRAGAGASIKEGNLPFLLSQKADKEDFKELQYNKTNKHDSELQMKALDIMHRQLDQTVILIMEII